MKAGDLAHQPPSSFAMTSALSSTVTAIELYEFPKVMPMATRSLGATTGLEAPFSLMVTRVWEFVFG